MKKILPPTRESIIQIHKDLSAPIIGIDTRPCEVVDCPKKSIRYHHHKIKNPILLDVNFTEIPADVLHRDIEFFISNDLRMEMEMPEFSDVEKLEQRGFDKKISFRKVR